MDKIVSIWPVDSWDDLKPKDWSVGVLNPSIPLTEKDLSEDFAGWPCR
jgi:hypothetical protein